MKNDNETYKENGNLFNSKNLPRLDPPGKQMICRPYITLRNGNVLHASQVGKKAYCFYVDA